MSLAGCAGISSVAADAGTGDASAGDSGLTADASVGAGEGSPGIQDASGEEAAACPASLQECGQVCVDVSDDPDNCGACGTRCQGEAFCIGGTCTSCVGCAAGSICCAESSGLGVQCVNATDDPDNCGGCGLACSSIQVCDNGGCVDKQGDGGTGSPCVKESDCNAGYDCGYAVLAGCNAPGKCEPRPTGPFSGALTAYCGCDGLPIEVGNNFAGGYAPTPVESGFDCSSDAGACSGWGQGCSTSATCCTGLQCIDAVPGTLPGYCVP